MSLSELEAVQNWNPRQLSPEFLIQSQESLITQQKDLLEFQQKYIQQLTQAVLLNQGLPDLDSEEDEEDEFDQPDIQDPITFGDDNEDRIPGSEETVD